jgi:hypothetical protein
MVEESLRRKVPIGFQTLQRIKTQEYQRFFSSLDHYYMYLNHLGEIQWMKSEEAEKQHEFFLQDETFLERLKRILSFQRYPDLNKLSQAEKEIRLQIRAYLDQKHIGRLSSETQQMMPSDFKHTLTQEDIEHIPIVLDALNSNKWKISVFSIFLILSVITAAVFYYYILPKEATGKLMVRTNINSGRIFLNDKNFLGYTGKELLNIPVGISKISVAKSGYLPIPKFQEVNIVADSLVTLHFQLKPLSDNILGYLKINANYLDSDIFIDSEYFGKIHESPVLALENGLYQISIHKEGYVTVPGEKTVIISAGDTTLLSVEQIALSSPGGKSATGTSRLTKGSLEVSANVSGAKIFINGRDTRKRADYVFTNLDMGTYTVSLIKEGYISNPEEKVIRLSSATPTGDLYFTLKQEYETVSIKTDLPDAAIIIDGDEVANGSFSGPLAIGEHEVSFGRMTGYNSPRNLKINVKPRLRLNLKVEYYPQLQIIAQVTNNGNINSQDCKVLMGYTYDNRGFTPSEEGGPQVIFHDKVSDYYWKLGYAFPFRNPKGNNAIQVEFELPRDLNFDQILTLKVHAAISEDKYPLAFGKKTDISIKFNNTILSYYYQPKTMDDIGNIDSQEWDITPYVKGGKNLLEIATTQKNNTYYLLKKIEIFN